MQNFVIRIIALKNNMTLLITTSCRPAACVNNEKARSRHGNQGRFKAAVHASTPLEVTLGDIMTFSYHLRTNKNITFTGRTKRYRISSWAQFRHSRIPGPYVNTLTSGNRSSYCLCFCVPVPRVI